MTPAHYAYYAANLAALATAANLAYSAANLAALAYYAAHFARATYDAAKTYDEEE